MKSAAQRIFWRHGTLTVVSRPLLLFLAALVLRRFYQRVRLLQERNSLRRPLRRANAPANKRNSLRFDRTLFRRLLGLISICFSHVFSAESGLVVLLTALLMLRTTLTLTFAQLSSDSVKVLVEKKLRPFLFGLLDIGMYAIPATITTVGIGFTTATLEQRFREKLQNVLHQEYFKGNRVHELATTNIVDNPAHRVTNDVQRFCTELANLLPAVIKPIMDIVIFSSALTKFGGYGISLAIMAYYTCVALVFRLLIPNFAGWVAKSREKEAQLRLLHTQLIQHAEEVAFYRGAEVERKHAERLLSSFVRLERRLKKSKFLSSMISGLLVKYGATSIGYAACALLVARGKSNLDQVALTQLFVRSAQLYIPLSVAMGKLFSLHLKVGSLLGSAYRVGELRDALSAMGNTEQNTPQNTVIVPNSDRIVFKDVTIVSPADKVLLRDFTWTFKAGCHVIIMGCNGSGKTSFMRALCDLWPQRGGTVERPPMSNIIFLTQQIYLPPGTLRTQLIYPAVEEQERAKNPRGVSDELLLQYADDVGLGGIVEREGGLDAEKEWSEFLSGGERQRIALVRAMYHRPTFVFLDECTSAISQDVEPSLYKILQRYGMTLITVSHRETLKDLHEEVMRMDGMGGYSISTVEDFE